ncbi:putative disease resistance RPP13-like protein 1 [Zingiber officinale]|uniref:Uncharacterized protein n=1 Tax=Zingiber officinale TaxID=94328 RepID=A0A8J5KSH5_ZINOF|nr:putative disease resistance RPP13-like protein 1 [Zingiber officinale]KAG6498548.1 hypothetical protein ZIOFF_038268 [Zingiber officinale]
MAMIPDFLVTRYLTKLTDFLEGEICKVLGVKEEIKKFKRRLERLSPYLQDAEKKRHQDNRVNTWLRDLKGIVYDAEDIIELCTLPGGSELMSLQPLSSSSTLVSRPFTLLASCFACTKFRHEIAVSFERLNDRLKEIKDDSEIIAGLVPLMSHPWSQDHPTSQRLTTSLEVKADIVGAKIENDAQTVINMILKHDHKHNGVFGIVGMGGIGKTTMAHKIFHDERVKNSFPTRIWICVSKNYTRIELLKEMLKQAKGSDDGAQSIEELELKLVGALVNRFFLVLDDVWSVNAWTDVLRKPILIAKSNGIILVTGRHKTVMEDLRASYIHHVQRMNKDDGLELFHKVVFEDEKNEDPDLDEMAAKIVSKCDGLPLAIKVMAGMLISKKRTRREWERVLESDLWRMRDKEDELPAALYLSYEDLSSVLKQCFLCCASYIGISYRTDLVRLWIAEGLIHVPNGGLMEEVAEDYYKELVMRNLLHLDPRYSDEIRYSMHDLLRALGTNLIGDEALVISDGRVADTNNPNPLTQIRRLWMSSKGDTLRLPGAVLEQKSLRVLQLHDCTETKTIEDEAAALPALKNLRVLDVCEIQIECLPDFIFMNLLLLRYLDLDRTMIREIPESIGRLANLQTLNISGCESLRSIPKAVTSLGMLRCLRVRGTPLTHLPIGMGSLTNLNHIEGFVVGHGDSRSNADVGCDMEELRSLSNLRFLSACKLERATLMAGPSVLENKPLLRHLSLLWTKRKQRDDGEKEAAEKTCSGLLPPSSLEELTLHNFPGRRFPNWMMSTSSGTSFPHLEFLILCNFPCCTELPPLGQLPRLKFLKIEEASAVRKVGPEFLGVCFPQAEAFPRLEVLKFTGMPNWEEWTTLYAASEERSLKLFSRLERCSFTGCPKLRGLPESIYCAARLKTVVVSTSDQLSEVEFRRRETMEMDDCPDLILARDSTELPHWLLDRIDRERDEKNSELPSRTVITVKANVIVIKQNRQVDAV